MSDPVNWNRVKDIVADALEQDATTREAFIERTCAEDPALLAEVKGLLNASEPTSGILDSEVTLALVGGSDGGGLSGRTVGRYRVGALIAEGGMGVVYEAEQEQPRRQVALKLMRPAFVSPSALRQFQYEIELLGRLENPAIARIYEAGVHESEAGAMPYFAMELIRGGSLTDHAEEQDLPVAARLALMADIADAVHDAHQQGIIHRDLKPQNILVDASGRPKILDFGIARATGVDDALTVPTMANEVVGTLPYMSPEQTVGGNEAVDVRTDVYALGVILYRLLSGRLPLQLEGLSMTEAIAAITLREPVPLGVVAPALHDDVCVITHKALEKEKARRYPSASEFAADLRRYLADEPIVARPPSPSYLFRRFVKRHRLVVTASVAVLLAVIGGLIATSIGFIRAADERDQAILAEKQARRAEAEARAAETRARGIATYLQDILGAADPSEMGPQTTLGDLLRSAEDDIDTIFRDDPTTRIQLHALFGSTYHELGSYEEALRHLEAALSDCEAVDGPESGTALDLRGRVARTLVSLGRLDEAAEYARDALALAEEELGPDHVSTLTLRQVGTDILALRDAPEAEDALQQLLEDARDALGPADDLALSIANDLAVYYLDREQSQEALPLVELVLKARLAEGNGRSASVVAQLVNHAGALSGVGRDDEAERSFRRALALAEDVLPAGHPRILLIRGNLASFYSARDRFDEALPLAEEVYETQLATHGLAHEGTLLALNNLAFLEMRMERWSAAQEHSRTAAQQFEKLYDADHRMTLVARQNWASALEGLGEVNAARAILEDLVERFHATYGPGHLVGLPAENNLAMLQLKSGEAKEAVATLTALVAACRAKGDEGKSYLPLLLRNIGRALTEAGDFSAAREALDEAMAKAGDALGEPREEQRKTADALMKLYEAWGKPEEAARWARYGAE